jgi:hypothetical protein
MAACRWGHNGTHNIVGSEYSEARRRRARRQEGDMPEQGPATLDQILRRLRSAAEEDWGNERLPVLDGSLARLATALATVLSAPLAGGEEPFPTGPEAMRV